MQNITEFIVEGKESVNPIQDGLFRGCSLKSVTHILQ